MRQLLRCQADMHGRDEVGGCPLHFAAMQGHEGCVRELLSAGADFQAAGNDGDAALILAADSGHEEWCLRELVGESKTSVCQ